jgi:hypothetical protein
MSTTRLYPNLEQQEMLDTVAIRLIRRDELDRWERLMCDHHYLRDATMVGRGLRYVAEVKGEWIALLGWNSAAYHLKAREAWIGWSPAQRQKRLALVAQNSRFLILPGVQCPNLASRLLALNAQRLDADWRAAHGHGLLLGESFVDPERYLGTCYRAAKWRRLGRTGGYARAGKDYYVAHDRPKELWVLPLAKNAARALGAAELPECYRSAESELPPRTDLKAGELSSLLDLFWTLPDARRAQGRRHRVGCVLACAAAAVLAGARTYADLATVADQLGQGQLRALRAWRNQRTGHYEPPSEATFWRVLSEVPAQTLDDTLGKWQLAHAAQEKAIAVDGKTLRGAGVHLFSAFLHTAQAVVSQQRVPEKTNEITRLADLLKDVPLEGKVITSDALHTQQSTARHLVQDRGADYALVVKDNQPTVRQQCENRLPQPAFSPSTHTG